MTPGYDAIVIGAGVGGLAAAAKLGREGLRVLVLEREPVVGGTAQVFTRQGFAFPKGPMAISSITAVRQALHRLGDEADLALTPARFQVRAFGLAAPISLPFPELKRELGRRFPAETAGIERFFKEVSRIGEAQARPANEASAKLLATAARTAAADYLALLIKDGRLRRLLGSLGASEPYSSLALLAAMWRLMAEEGVYCPEGGMPALIARLQRAAGSPGGNGARVEFRTGVEVAEIRVRGNRVQGVVLKSGELVAAAAVISNADYKCTFLKLLPPEAVPEDFFQAVFMARQTESNLQAALGVDAGRLDLTVFHQGDRVIFRRQAASLDPDQEKTDWSVPQVAEEVLAGQEMEVSLFSRGPQGRASLVIRTPAEYYHFTKYRPSPGRRLPSYYEYKQRLGRVLVQTVEEMLTGLSEAIQVMDVATPLTFEERGGRSGGAVAGWSWDFEDCRETRPRELIRTPIHGLYMAGYQAFSSLFMGGMATALLSGIRAAEAVVRAEPPVNEILIPGAGEEE